MLSIYLNLASIRVKVWFLIVLNISLALFLAGAGLLGYETYVQRSEGARQLTAEAGVLAEGITASLSFNDAKAARETLATLRGDSHISEAAIYDPQGVAFAQYRKAQSEDLPPAAIRRDGAFFRG